MIKNRVNMRYVRNFGVPKNRKPMTKFLAQIFVTSLLIAGTLLYFAYYG